ncbi:MAG: hypothetical protein ACRD4S_01100 [Candidatus Acidiferrales bacterium]
MAPKRPSNKKPLQRDRSRKVPDASAATHSASGEPEACPNFSSAATLQTAVEDDAGLKPGATKPSPPSRQRLSPRALIAEGLRSNGLDEIKVGQIVAKKVLKLEEKTGKDKLVLEHIKLAISCYEPMRTAERNIAGDAPINVQLIHVVPRPERNAP